jgi:hypothetical protein
MANVSLSSSVRQSRRLICLLYRTMMSVGFLFFAKSRKALLHIHRQEIFPILKDFFHMALLSAIDASLN